MKVKWCISCDVLVLKRGENRMPDCSKCENEYRCTEGMREFLSADCTEFKDVSPNEKEEIENKE